MHGASIAAEGITRLGPDDLAAVKGLEGMCFAYHWSEDQLRLGLEKGAYVVLGLKAGGLLLGYIAFSLAADEMEVLNLAVHPDHRRRGLGSRLLGAMLEHGEAAGVRCCYLDVKPSNKAAIDLYRNFGFKKYGVRKKYYPDNGEDALLLRRCFRIANAS
ncbi:MAG: ribosomal protein S18-alanine N-acetyltransferase [Desulfovibrionaceae bacterium]|nr:ribosomal protein S18-alanine N-acetyltransferase [Desulfovibrionaceae bacterium]